MLRFPSFPLVGLALLIVSVSGCGGNQPQPGSSTPDPALSTPPAKSDAAGKSTPSAELTLMDSVRRDDLAKVVRTELSKDGKFLYAICWNPGSLVVFARDPMTGNLTHVQTIGNLPELLGATSLALSPDGRFAVSAAFQSKAVILFRRNKESGKLTQLDVAARSGQDLEFPTAVAFSPDGKSVCIADDGGQPGHSGVRVYKLAGEKLRDAGMDLGSNRCYSGARGLAFHPGGKTLFVACCRPGSLVVADFDRDSGGIKVRQVLWSARKGGTDFSKSDVGGVPGIDGLIDVVASPDGRFVTTCSGRFGGTTAVTSFKFGDDRHLALVSWTKSSGAKFLGGNQLAVTPDGQRVYAAGTLSGVIAVAARDPKSGDLLPSGTVPDGGPPSQSGKTKSPAGVAVSSDGRFVYVATEDKNAISIFRRNLTEETHQ